MLHKNLSKEKWAKFSFEEQMANIGSEVLRATSWKERGNREYATLACYRALELIDCSLAQPFTDSKIRELTRMREMLVDYFLGKNIYASTAFSWRSYFGAFTFAAARIRA